MPKNTLKHARFEEKLDFAGRRRGLHAPFGCIFGSAFASRQTVRDLFGGILTFRKTCVTFRLQANTTREESLVNFVARRSSIELGPIAISWSQKKDVTFRLRANSTRLFPELSLEVRDLFGGLPNISKNMRDFSASSKHYETFP